MFNLIKMDFYRLLHSKVIKVGVIVAAIVAFLGMLLNLGIIEILKFGESNDPSSLAGMEILFPTVSWIVSGVDYADVVFTGTNALSLFVSCMIVASFIGAEQSCGYVKNIAGQLPNRGMTVISKYIVTCTVQLVILLIYTLIAIIFSGLFFSSLITSYSIGAMVAGLALRFLLFCAINAVLIFFCTLTKSHAIAMVVGAILGIGVTGLVYFSATGLLSMMNITLDVAKIMPDGINGLISVASITSVGAGNLVVQAIVVSVIFIGAFLTGAVLLFSKRDVK